MKKTIACIFAFCLMSISAYAANVQCGDFDASGKAEISGSLDGTAAAQIVVFAPVSDPSDAQKTIPIDLDSATAAEIASSVVYVNDVTVSGEKNTFSLPIRMKDADLGGIYTIRITSGGATVAKNTFRYDSPAEKRNAVRAINSAVSAEDMLSKIGEYESVLCANFALYSRLSTGKARTANYLFRAKEKQKAINAVGFDEVDPTNALEVFRYSAAVAAFADASVVDKTAVMEYLLCIRDNAKIAKWYDKADVADSIKALWHSGIAGRLSGQSFDDFTDFEGKLTAALIFEVIKNHDGVDNIAGILTDFAEEVGISDVSAITVSRCNQIKGKTYDGFSYQTMLADLFAATPSYTPAGGGSGGGGGGGLGGSSYVPSVSVTGGTQSPQPIDPDSSETLIFKDMSDSMWANEAVEELYKKGIIAGKAEGVFAPDDHLLREEFVKMIVGAAGLHAASSETRFADVAKEDWFFEYVIAASDHKMINGVSENEFGVGQSITRQDAAVMIYNTLKTKGADLPEAESAESFSDASAIADYAKDAVAVLTEMKVLNGYEDHTFRPAAPITRAEAAKIIYGIVEMLNG